MAYIDKRQKTIREKAAMRELGRRYNGQIMTGNRKQLDDAIEQEIQLTLIYGEGNLHRLNRGSSYEYPGYFGHIIVSKEGEFEDFTKRIVRASFIPFKLRAGVRSLEEAFANFREQTGLSKVAFDRLSGVSQTTIRYIENRVRDNGNYNGTTRMGKITFDRYFALMNVNPKDRELLTTLFYSQK